MEPMRTKLRGVNLGGWLLLEKWMVPSLFEGLAATDETTWCVELGAAAPGRLRRHWRQFIRREDFAWIAERGLNGVRIPVGHWIFGPDYPYHRSYGGNPHPFVTGGIDVLDRALKFAPLEQVLDKWLMPELARLGQAWANDEVSVAEEHFASAGVMRALGRVYDELPDAERPEVLVGLPEGSYHQVGLMSFAVCLRRLGVGVVYLGDDVPVADWEAAAGTLQPRAAVVGVPLCSKVAKAQEVVDRLNAASPPIAVWAGGSLAPKVRRAQQLSDAVAEAADEVSTALRAGAMH